MSEFQNGGPPEQAPRTGNEWGILVILSFFFVLFLVLELAREFSTAKLSVPFFLLSWGLLLVIHEFGHALMARFVGWRVKLISIGTGRIVSRLMLAGMPLEFRAIPLSGFVIPEAVDDRLPDLKQFLIFAAGPGAELICVGLMVAVFGSEVLLKRTPDVFLIAIQSFCVAALLGVFMNLLPFSHETKGGRGWSDGLGMILCWRKAA
ncbi:MAG: M50 family metallopeptidase [Verrucomicrobiales bacterium]|nr:M50 family metallopeptidase [Verrucomicrobiales bacterium]